MIHYCNIVQYHTVSEPATGSEVECIMSFSQLQFHRSVPVTNVTGNAHITQWDNNRVTFLNWESRNQPTDDVEHGLEYDSRRDHAATQPMAVLFDAAALTGLLGKLAMRVNELNVIRTNMSAVLPVGPVEPSVLRVDINAGPYLAEISTIGTLIAPAGILAHDVELRGLPAYLLRGRPLKFELALAAGYPSTAPAELEAVVSSCLSHVYVDVLLLLNDVPQPLHATVAPAAGGRGVEITCSVPESACSDSHVFIREITVAGQPVRRGVALPAHLSVVMGMHAPLRLEGAVNLNATTPVISVDGSIYVPAMCSSDVLVFSADGTPQLSLPVASFGLSMFLRAAAYDEATSTLLLADCNGVTSKLVAADAASRVIRWSTEAGGNSFCIAVLPAQGIAVTSTNFSNELRVHSLVDGAAVVSVPADSPSYIAADTDAAILYVSSVGTVSAFRWSDGSLVPDGIVEAAGNTACIRPLTVIPPAPRQCTSYLIVGTCNAPTLLVLSLPDRRLVHTHTLEGTMVVGLAADPSGTTFAVCDSASGAVHVLPWPLPGMPPPLQ
jgi:hypothetical protein